MGSTNPYPSTQRVEVLAHENTHGYRNHPIPTFILGKIHHVSGFRVPIAISNGVSKPVKAQLQGSGAPLEASLLRFACHTQI
jgi:hypothetical protein